MITADPRLEKAIHISELFVIPLLTIAAASIVSQKLDTFAEHPDEYVARCAKIVSYDGCEYLVTYNNAWLGASVGLSHKGNCTNMIHSGKAH